MTDWNVNKISAYMRERKRRRLACGILSDRIYVDVFTFLLVSIDSTDCVLCMQKMFTSCQFFPHFNFLWRLDGAISIDMCLPKKWGQWTRRVLCMEIFRLCLVKIFLKIFFLNFLTEGGTSRFNLNPGWI